MATRHLEVRSNTSTEETRKKSIDIETNGAQADRNNITRKETGVKLEAVLFSANSTLFRSRLQGGSLQVVGWDAKATGISNSTNVYKSELTAIENKGVALKAEGVGLKMGYELTSMGANLFELKAGFIKGEAQWGKLSAGAGFDINMKLFKAIL